MNKQQFKQWCNTFESLNSSPPLIMGILNITPDSFSDGGGYLKLDKALEQARRFLSQGVDIIDIGGESSRPGAKEVSLNEELDRVLPIIEKIRQESDISISVDTVKVGVMKEAIKAGASIINDISALSDPSALALAAELDIPVCLMHMQGTPRTMQCEPDYPLGVVAEIDVFFDQQIKRCLNAGIKKESIMLDPGFGFGKTVKHNLQIIHDLKRFKRHGLPILLGVSRKSTIGHILNKPVNERTMGEAALSVIAMLNGMNIIRTHDVIEIKQVLIMTQAVIAAYKKEMIHDTA